MTNREPPDMVPSAEDEADQILRIARDYPYSSAATIVSGVIHDTYRDGWNAAQARIAELEALTDDLQAKIADLHKPYWPKSIQEHVAELDAENARLQDENDKHKALMQLVICPRCFGTGGCNHVFTERVEFMNAELARLRAGRGPRA